MPTVCGTPSTSKWFASFHFTSSSVSDGTSSFTTACFFVTGLGAGGGGGGGGGFAAGLAGAAGFAATGATGLPAGVGSTFGGGAPGAGLAIFCDSVSFGTGPEFGGIITGFGFESSTTSAFTATE